MYKAAIKNVFTFSILSICRPTKIATEMLALILSPIIAVSRWFTAQLTIKPH